MKWKTDTHQRVCFVYNYVGDNKNNFSRDVFQSQLVDYLQQSKLLEGNKKNCF